MKSKANLYFFVGNTTFKIGLTENEKVEAKGESAWISLDSPLKFGKKHCRSIDTQIIGGKSILLIMMLLTMCICSQADQKTVRKTILPEKAGEIKTMVLKAAEIANNVTLFENMLINKESNRNDYSSENSGNLAYLVMFSASWGPVSKAFRKQFFTLVNALTINQEDDSTKEYLQDYSLGELEGGLSYPIKAIIYDADDNSINDQILKQYDINSFPKLMVAKDGRYWIYSGKKDLILIKEWLQTLDYDKSNFLDNYTPNISDDFFRFVRSIQKTYEITKQDYPEIFNELSIILIIVILVYLGFMIYALTCGKWKQEKEEKELNSIEDYEAYIDASDDSDDIDEDNHDKQNLKNVKQPKGKNTKQGKSNHNEPGEARLRKNK